MIIYHNNEKKTNIIIMLYEDEKRLKRKINVLLNRGEDLEALSILRENDRFLCLKNIRRIYNYFLMYQVKYYKSFTSKRFDNHNTLYFLIYISQHRYDLDIMAHNNLLIINACCNGQKEIVKLLLNDPRVDPSDQNNKAIMQSSDEEIIKMLLNDPRVDPSDQNNRLFIDMCSKGYTEIVKLLLDDERINPSAQNNGAIMEACWYGRSDVIELLLNSDRVIINPFYDDNIESIIIRAFHMKNQEIIKMLVSDKRFDQFLRNRAIISVCGYGHGHIENIKLLLNDERIDPSIRNNEAIKIAIKRNRLEVVELLLNNPKINMTNDLCNELLNNCPDDEINNMIRDKMNHVLF